MDLMLPMSPTALLLIMAIFSPILCQRPFYAGLSPIGFPSVEAEDESGFDGAKIPAQLNGDTVYAKKLAKLPVDQQPFWFLNRDQIEENLKNPQTYPQKPRGFNDNGI